MRVTTGMRSRLSLISTTPGPHGATPAPRTALASVPRGLARVRVGARRGCPDGGRRGVPGRHRTQASPRRRSWPQGRTVSPAIRSIPRSRSCPLGRQSAQALWAAVLRPAVLIVMRRGVIVHKESSVDRRCGDEYRHAQSARPTLDVTSLAKRDSPDSAWTANASWGCGSNRSLYPITRTSAATWSTADHAPCRVVGAPGWHRPGAADGPLAPLSEGQEAVWLAVSYIARGAPRMELSTRVSSPSLTASPPSVYRTYVLLS